jgi:hypothetical protein
MSTDSFDKGETLILNRVGKQFAGSGITKHFMKHWKASSRGNPNVKKFPPHYIRHANTSAVHESDPDFIAAVSFAIYKFTEL